ncbi:MAG: transketolase [Spirochaetales bacterium]|nr:transketolase [Spirochaetales bacterium]
MLSKDLELELIDKALETRKELIQMFSYGKAHHYGGSLSCVDILTVLYFYKMRFSFDLKDNIERDRFIMSKGHSIPTQYVILSMLGFFPKAELSTIKTFGSRLQGHPDINKTPGIEAPTGSLGQGLSFANGIALAGLLDKRNFTVYVLCGDGEMQEGQCWEAIMSASHYQLNNIRLIIDNNKYQSQGKTSDELSIDPLVEKFKAFGWTTRRVDGGNIRELASAFDSLDSSETPAVIIADTVKGSGIDFMEHTHKYHNYSLSKEEFEKAMKVLDDRIENRQLNKGEY